MRLYGPYVCCNCGEVFNDPRTYHETHGFTDGLYEAMSCCPYCGGDYVPYEEVEETDEEVDEEE